MKIAYIIPGFGGTFYCGNCLRDSTFSVALKNLGQEAVSVPLYLPDSFSNHAEKHEVPVFYGAVNIYLKQKVRFLRNMPNWLYHFFNSRRILEFASRKSGSTRAEGLEDITISMLMGKEGFQEKELSELIHYLKNHEKPDVVHLSNALLLGLAGEIKKELNIPVFCSLQDEDVWVDGMKPKYRQQIWNLMSEKAKDVDAFITFSQYFSSMMKKKMNLPDEKVHIVKIGLDIKRYDVHFPNGRIPEISYLSRINEENGFGVLVDAFILLKKKKEFSKVRMRVSGGSTGDDKKFINKQKKKLSKAGILDDITFYSDYSSLELGEFFNGASLLSVPVLKGEAYGLYQIEALASGIPLVQPELGAFPEIINQTGGGIVYSPNTAESLAAALSELLSDKDKIYQLGVNGRKAIEKDYNIDKTAEEIVELYRKYSTLISKK